MKKSLIALAMVATAGAAFAQSSFTVATGDSKGGSTYSQMYRELARVCGRDLMLGEQETTGSVQNMEMLTDNAVNAAFVQTDLLFFTKMTDPGKVANIKTLVALHPEELHFIARADVKKEGGFLGIGANSVVFNTVADLKGRVVGAVGGSVLSGRVFAEQSGLKFKVQTFPNNAALQAALLKGDVDTILVVGGAPHALVKTLDARFRLLAIDAATQKNVAAVYAPAVLSYTNLAQAGVSTVSTQALLVTRTYRSPTTLSQMSKFRDCFVSQVPEIQDTKKTHPKWQLVDAESHGKWAWYELPAAK